MSRPGPGPRRLHTHAGSAEGACLQVPERNHHVERDTRKALGSKLSRCLFKADGTCEHLSPHLGHQRAAPPPPSQVGLLSLLILAASLCSSGSFQMFLGSSPL